MIKYEFMYVDDEKKELDLCDCCGSEAPLHEFEAPMHILVKQPGLKFKYCEVCSCTMISQWAHGYYEQHRESVDVLCSLAAVTNLIFKRLDRLERVIKHGRRI